MAFDIQVLPCEHRSFFQLSEEVIPDRDSERPFHRICEIMRKSRARTVLVHRHVETESFYHDQYPHLVRPHPKRVSDGSVQCSVFSVQARLGP